VWREDSSTRICFVNSCSFLIRWRKHCLCPDGSGTSRRRRWVAGAYAKRRSCCGGRVTLGRCGRCGCCCCCCRRCSLTLEFAPRTVNLFSATRFLSSNSLTGCVRTCSVFLSIFRVVPERFRHDACVTENRQRSQRQQGPFIVSFGASPLALRIGSTDSPRRRSYRFPAEKAWLRPKQHSQSPYSRQTV